MFYLFTSIKQLSPGDAKERAPINPKGGGGPYLGPQQATLASLKITQQSTFYQHSTNKLRFG